MPENGYLFLSLDQLSVKKIRDTTRYDRRDRYTTGTEKILGGTKHKNILFEEGFERKQTEQKSLWPTSG